MRTLTLLAVFLGQLVWIELGFALNVGDNPIGSGIGMVLFAIPIWGVSLSMRRAIRALVPPDEQRGFPVVPKGCVQPAVAALSPMRAFDNGLEIPSREPCAMDRSH